MKSTFLVEVRQDYVAPINNTVYTAAQMLPIATDVACSVLCVSVCVLVFIVAIVRR